MTVTAMPKGAAKGAAKGDADAPPKKRKKLKLIAIVVVVLLAAGAAYFFLLAPKSSGPVAPKPGVTLKLDSMQINLAEGHYLRLGLALQLTTTASADFDGSAAQDAAISVYSGLSVGEADQAQQRTALKEKLLGQVEKLYPDEVMGIYYTEYVTQ